MGVFLEDEAVRLAGKMSVLTDRPSLLVLGRRFSYGRLNFVPIGRVRYAHSQGFWEEWWVLGDDGKPYWISVDEGDIAMETSLTLTTPVPIFADLKLGQTVRINGAAAQVTEKNSCTCAGAQGELPEAIAIGDAMDYVDLTGEKQEHFTLEYAQAQITAFQGRWIDPFEVKAA